MTTNTSSTKAEGLPEINRRRFLMQTATAGAAIAVTTPAATAAAPEMTPREQAIWHMRELERLALEDGAGAVAVTVVGRPAAWHGRGCYSELKMIMINHHGVLRDDCRMFALKGGAS